MGTRKKSLRPGTLRPGNGTRSVEPKATSTLRPDGHSPGTQTFLDPAVLVSSNAGGWHQREVQEVGEMVSQNSDSLRPSRTRTQ